MWDFRLPRVKSISTSGHKFGLAPLGAGWVIWRDAQDLPEDLIFKVNYLGGDMPTFAINFSRPAGQIVAQYYNFLRLGREGYRKVHMASYRTAQYLADEIVKLGPFELIASGDPSESIPAVTWKIKDGVNPGYTLFDLADRLRIGGWLVPAYTLPANLADVAVQRILVRQGLNSGPRGAAHRRLRPRDRAFRQASGPYADDGSRDGRLQAYLRGRAWLSRRADLDRRAADRDAINPVVDVGLRGGAICRKVALSCVLSTRKEASS